MTKRKRTEDQGGEGDVPPPKAVKKFSWSKCRYHLTYSTHLPLQDFHQFVLKTIGARELRAYSYVHESADENHPYEHTHVLICLEKAGAWKGCDKFDYKGIHPFVQEVNPSGKHWAHAWTYHEKEDGEKLRSDPLPEEDEFHLQVIQHIDSFEGTFEDLLRDPGPIGRYVVGKMKWAQTLFLSRAHKKLIPRESLTIFQNDVVDLLADPANDRDIYWVFDPYGHNGKSYLARFLLENGAAELDGPRSRMAFAYNNHPIIIIDLARNQGNDVDYTALEKFKDGKIFSEMYLPHLKKFQSPHIIVFSNSLPKPGVYTTDRLRVITIFSCDPRPSDGTQIFKKKCKTIPTLHPQTTYV